MRFAFEDLVLDDETFELRRDGELVAVEPQVFDVLRYLITNRDRVVEKSELLDGVWGDQFVSESALSTRIKQARQAVGDDGKAQRVIRTSHGRGYRFVAALRGDHDGPDPGPSHAAPTDPAMATPLRRPRSVDLQGRADDVEAVGQRLAGRRLVTLVGMGGIGKTNLLHHVGATLADRYDEGSVAVELAPVRSAEAVAAALLEALGGGDQTGLEPGEAALRWLEHRQILVLIDNAEHVARDVAELCRSILRRCERVDILVTSRERLNVVGESVQQVGPLDHEAAVTLFVDRAYDAGADLDPGRHDVIELCRRLDGVPLAIEILAARVPLLSIADLTTDLERHLGATNANGDDRRRTLQAALRWSFDGLPELERRLLEDLTVFAGAFDLEAAEVVSALDDVTEPLLDLCRRSLVVPSPEATVSRFRLLEPVRLFAASSNAVIDEARSRHRRHYLDVAERADRLLRTPDLDQGFELLSTEWPNIRAAFDAAEAAGDAESVTRLVVAVTNYAEGRILTEVHRWGDRAGAVVGAAGADPDPELSASLARFALHRGALAETGEFLAGVDPDHPSNHVRMGFIGGAWYAGRLDEVFDRLDPAIEELRGEGGYWELSFMLLRTMASPAIGERPLDLLDRLEAQDDRDRPIPALVADMARAIRAWWVGEIEAAIALLDRAVEAAESRRLGGFAQLAHSLRASAYRSVDDPRRAAAAVADSIRRGFASGGRSLVADSLATAAAIVAGAGRSDAAVQIMAARRAAGYRSGSDARPLIARLEDDLGVERFTAADERGRSLDLKAATDLALAELAAVAGVER